ncbi:LamG-like jellyroll fold domain-containing protein [Acrocarpospora corrugata]|nr:LamG domain-containing protein [Acrocarpospora corrugata]
MDDKNLLRVYSDREYISTTMVRHAGMVVAFALSADRRIYYSVLGLDQADRARGALDAAYWNAEPGLLPFPTELVDVSADVPVPEVMPVVKKRGGAEVLASETLLAGENDPFLSTTARLTSAFPIQVLSDGRHILLFRQSIAADEGDAVYATTGGGADLKGTDDILVGRTRDALTDASLLCDRFVLVGSELKPVVEVRYQRSRSKVAPASGGDTLGTRDMEGKLFFEPTLKLSFVGTLSEGMLSVLLLPTAVAGSSRWQIFTGDAETGAISSYNLEQSTDGLFNVKGTQLYTSPDPKFAASVLERAPGIDSHTGQPLVPVRPSRDRAGTALRFEGDTSGPVIAGEADTAVPAGPYTLEAWIKPASPKGIIVGRTDADGADTPVQLSLNADGKLVFTHGAQTLTSATAVPMKVYTHVAAVFDGSQMRLFLDGAPAGTHATTTGVEVTAKLLVGKRHVSGPTADPFTGEIDEVRVWNLARTDFTGRAQRLAGTEPGLFAYFPFDEGAGAEVRDRSANRFAGSLEAGPVWTSSDAPLYDGPGVVRHTFSIAGRKVVAGLTATMYYQQESMATGYATTAAPEKRQARVLLACATSGPPPEGQPTGRHYVATVDFALSQEGKLATPPGVVDLSWLGRPNPTEDEDRRAEAEAAVTAARGQLYNDQALAQKLPGIIARLDAIHDEVYGGVPGFTLHDLNENIKGPARDWGGHRQRERDLLAEAAGLEGRKAEGQAARSRLGSDQATFQAARNALAILSGGLMGAAEAVLPMPTVHTDRSGLTVLGALLSFAWTTHAPALLDSSTGDVALYFRGGKNEFFSAYYSTTIHPAAKQIVLADQKALRLTSRDTAANLADFAVTVSADGPGRCAVVVTQGAATETFTAAPDQADLLAAVLNGSTRGTDLGVVVAVKDKTVTLAEPPATSPEPGSAIMVGEQSRTVATAPTGSAQITLTTGNLTAGPGAQVRTAVYDYTHATSTVPGMSAARGSLLVSAHAESATSLVPAGTAEDLSEPLAPRWHGDAPGRAFSFDAADAQRLEMRRRATVDDLAPTGDLSLEAWAYPTFVDGPTQIVQAELSSADYRLGLDKATLPTGEAGYVIVAEVDRQAARGSEAFPLSEWGHLAMSFEQSWAMGMDGTAYLDAGGPGGLDIVDDLTIEAFVKLDSLDVTHGLVGKGALGAGTHQAVPYSLYVAPGGVLTFAFESGSGGTDQLQVCPSALTLSKNVFYKVAVTRRNPTTPDGPMEIRFYVVPPDASRLPSSHSYNCAKPVGNDAPVELGRHHVGKNSYGLRGALSEVRIWNVAREPDQIGAPITEKATGLAAWWTFPEFEGSQTADRCGSYPATLHHVERVPTPDPAGNRFTFYRNGTATPATVSAAPARPRVADPRPTDRWSGGLDITGGSQPRFRPRFNLAASEKPDGSFHEAFTGNLDEIRVWRTIRTQEQVLDNMFGRIRGDRRDLIAYYPFDLDDTVAGADVSDAGLGGHHLTQSSAPPAIVLSNAPISTDSAQVRSALAGIGTAFHASIAHTPAATEYGDIQEIAHGGLIGVMKRAYTYIRDTSWVLSTGFKVGELTTTWVGQAQFDPQLIGYIEGAPPVPSENLIAGAADDYAGASSIAFVQADNVVNALSSHKNTSVDASLKMTFSSTVKDDTWTVSAPLGVGIAKPAGSVELDMGASVELKFSNSWSHDTKVSQGANTTRTSKVELTGGWEGTDTSRQANPVAGQRWVPANTGFAVVQSETADLYALRLAHSGALVAYRMLPSPDIPRDWNLIPFPINPRYTKQGTLDGIIGYGEHGTAKEPGPFADPDFPNAATGVRGEFSYYRPAEAYRIKKRIQREQQQLQGFYDSVSTETHVPDPTHGQAAKVLNGMMGGTGAEVTQGGNPEAGRAAVRAASRRNIVNTYVWTAAGGFFAETTGTTDQVTETTAGSFTFNATRGGHFSLGFEAFGQGLKFGVEASMGAGYSVTRTKSKEATRTFSLDVHCAPGRRLQKHDGDTPLFDIDGRPALVPGRVDAYRFMSLYLDTTTDNFEDFYGKVIDPEWLDRSSDPNAQALKAARQAERKPPCWRIMHRVTFVSRVLSTTPAAHPSLEQAMATQKIISPYALIKKLEPYLGASTADPTALTAATRTAITERFPAFIPYLNNITALLISYYEATGAPAAPSSTLATDTPTIAKGTFFTVRYSTAPDTRSAKNWIGLYPASKRPSEQEAIDWKYAPDASGTITLTTGTVPGPGSYRAWYLHDNGYIALTDPLTVTVT